MNKKRFVWLASLWAVPVVAFGEVVRVGVVHEPRLVSSVSSKTERGTSNCQWCDCKIRYDRTYKWDPYDREWIETTKEVPSTCRKCKSNDKEIEKLRRAEANLDRKLALRETRQRIAEKRERLRNWTRENR